MINVYVAAPFRRRMFAEHVARLLEGEGFTVTSSWVHTTEEDGDCGGAISPADAKRNALVDLDDLMAADHMLLLNFPNGRGGMHVEFGYALASGVKCVVIGKPTTIFHYLQDVEVYPSVRAYVSAWRDRRRAMKWDPTDKE